MERSTAKTDKRAAEPEMSSDFVPGIPDTPENIAKALLNSPPKKPHEWRFMQRHREKKRQVNTAFLRLRCRRFRDGHWDDARAIGAILSRARPRLDSHFRACRRRSNPSSRSAIKSSGASSPTW